MRAHLLVLALLLTACGNYKADIDTFCNVDERSGANGDRAQRAVAEAKYLDANVKSRQGRAFFDKFAGLDTSQRATLLREEATKAGVTPCPYADDLATRK